MASLFNNDVTIITGNVGGCAPTNNGDISVVSALVRTDTLHHILTLHAIRDIEVDVGGSITGTGNTVFIAGRDIGIGGPVTTTLGDITFTATTGEISLGASAGVNAIISATMQISTGITLTSATGVTLQAQGANFAQIGTPISLSGGVTTNCDITITTQGEIFLEGDQGGAGTGGYAQIGHGGVFSSASDATLTGNININTTSDIRLNAGVSAGSFAQIGHTVNTGTGNTTLTGYISVQAIDPGTGPYPQGITMIGGTGAGAYKLIGFGGQIAQGTTFYINSQIPPLGTDPFSINFQNNMGNFSLTGGLVDFPDTYAAIGFTGAPNVDFSLTPSPNPAFWMNPAFAISPLQPTPATFTLQAGNGASATAGAYFGVFLYDGTVTTGIVLPPAPQNYIMNGIGGNYDFMLLGPASAGTNNSFAAIGIDALPGSGDVGMSLGMANINSLTLNAQNSTNIIGGAFIQSGIGNPLSQSAMTTFATSTATNINVTASSSSSAFINATRQCGMLVGNNVTFTGTADFPAYLNVGQDETVILPLPTMLVFNTISFNDFAMLTIPANTVSGPVTLEAGVNISITNNSVIQSLNNNADIILVVDALFPSSPDIGPGQFTLDATSTITTLGSSAQLRIYTARFPQNMILGLLNGVDFMGTRFVDDSQNEYLTYYPNGSFISAAPFYRIYYKEGIIPPFIIPPFHRVPDLQLYDQEERWDKTFTISYDSSFMPMTFLNNWKVPFPFDLAKDALYKLYRHVGSPSIEAMDFLWSEQLFGTEEYFERFKKHLLNQDPF